ncbi:hypothetical protein D3C73_1314760 [compost metagenome]
MMPAAEVEPLHSVEVRAEFLVHDLDRPLQRVGVLLAHRVEMQAFDAFQLFRPEVIQRHAESGIVIAGIVQRNLDFGILGIHANAAADVLRCALHFSLVAIPLIE